MRSVVLLALLTVSLASAQTKTLRAVLLEQLRTTNDKAEWFAPFSAAVDGITAKQATWTDGSGNHSIGQLTAHLAFWNKRALAQFKGSPAATSKVINDETFNNFDAAQWTQTVQALKDVMKEWEEAVESATDEKLEKAASVIAHIGAHNAYHIGQMVYVRKLQGSWDPSKGVK